MTIVQFAMMSLVLTLGGIIPIQAQVQDSLPPDSILCQRYGSFVPNENRVFHSMMFDSLAAVEVSDLEDPDLSDLLLWYVMRHPDVNIPLKPYKEHYQKMLTDSTLQSYLSLNFGELTSIYLSNLIVQAKVVGKNELQRKHRFFKSTYLLQIEEIYKSDWSEIQVGDTIVLKSAGGLDFTGPTDNPHTLVRTGGYKSYTKGSSQLFALSNANYHKATYGVQKHTQWAVQNYEDYPCSGFFRAAPGDNRLYNDFDKVEDLQEYIKKYLNE